MTVVKKSSDKFQSLTELVHEVHQCTLCQNHLPYPAKPVISIGMGAKIVIIGQAPGIKAHESSTPWNDASGDRLRGWLGINKETFYDPAYLALMPMGFCFPGYLRGADAPPRKECAPTWHHKLLSHLNPELTLLVGRYAQHYYLPEYRNLTEAVHSQAEKGSGHFVLPHPSGRNNRWLTQHPWFEEQVLPLLRKKVQALLG